MLSAALLVGSLMAFSSCAFDVTTTKEGDPTMLVKQNDVVSAVMTVKFHPQIPEGAEEIFFDTGEGYLDFMVSPTDERVAEGWWKGTIGAALGEKRVITVPPHEAFSATVMKEWGLRQGYNHGLLISMEIVKINQFEIEKFHERFHEADPLTSDDEYGEIPNHAGL